MLAVTGNALVPLGGSGTVFLLDVSKNNTT
jgi:hypothetical protein